MIHWQPGLTLESIEQIVISKALKHFEGNKTRTAHALGVSIRTIDNKLKKYGMTPIKDDFPRQVAD